MIDEKATFGEFGYHSYDLSPKSDKKIVCVCDDCGKVRITTKSSYRSLCESCGHKGEKVKLICEQCGIEFELLPSKIRNGGGKFCSRKCRGEWVSEHKKGENSPLWKPRVKHICKTCGKEFEVAPYDIKRGRGKFCSPECQGKWRSKHKRGENHPNWQGGISFEPYCEKFDEPFREYIREKFGRVCFLCPKTEAENGRRLSVHHVNYDKDCLCDDNLTCQFVPLCMSCHGKLNGNRKKWEAKINNMLHNSLKGWYI